LRSCGKIRRDSAGQLAVTSVVVKHGGNWLIPGKNIAFMKEKLKLDLVMNLNGKITAYDLKENFLFR
jgi:hypothetical protein